jgi:type II secretory pathway component PulF
MDSEARNAALETYARIDLDLLVTPPKGVLRTSVYLLLLSLVLVAMVSTFNLFVMPSLQAFSQINAGVMPESSLQIACWMPLLLVGVLILAVYTLASSLALRGVLAAVDSGRSAARFEWLLPTPVRRHRGRLLELIAIPVSGLRAGPLQVELEALAASGLRIEDELPALLRLQAQRLLHAAHRFNFGLLSVLAATVFACIATLLVALYLPIFKMGSLL